MRSEIPFLMFSDVFSLVNKTSLVNRLVRCRNILGFLSDDLTDYTHTEVSSALGGLNLLEILIVYRLFIVDEKRAVHGFSRFVSDTIGVSFFRHFFYNEKNIADDAIVERYANKYIVRTDSLYRVETDHLNALDYDMDVLANQSEAIQKRLYQIRNDQQKHCDVVGKLLDEIFEHQGAGRLNG